LAFASAPSILPLKRLRDHPLVAAPDGGREQNRESAKLMPPRVAIRIATRRDVLAGASAAAAFAVLTGCGPAGTEEVGGVAPHSQAFKDLFRDIVGNATPAPRRISLDLPEYAENGNGVSFTLAVESPMTETDHVCAMHLLST